MYLFYIRCLQLRLRFSLTNHAGNGGRGLNIALINSKRLEVKDFVTFDVYIDNSIVMDMWLNASVRESDVLVIFTFDEASRMLAESSKKLFYDYGINFCFEFTSKMLLFIDKMPIQQEVRKYKICILDRNGTW